MADPENKYRIMPYAMLDPNGKIVGLFITKGLACIDIDRVYDPEKAPWNFQFVGATGPHPRLKSIQRIARKLGCKAEMSHT